MKTKIYSILKYNEYHQNYIDVYSDSNYLKVLNLYNSLTKKYLDCTFVLVEVLQC